MTRKPFLHLLAAACLALLMSADAARADPPKYAEWEMTFHDEFDGTAVDWDVWDSEKGPRGAQKLEGRWPENNVVKDGILRQVIRKEDPPRGGKSWSSAHIWTKRFSQQYGYFECRMRYGRYLNNAFWLYRPRNRFPERPHFEIDVNEGHTPRELAMTFHFYHYPEGDPEGDLQSTGKTWNAPMDLEKEFHVYGVDWDERRIVWYFDGTPVRALTNPIAHAPADIRLSTVMMHSQLERDHVALDTMEGTAMEVDWVRVYQRTRKLSEPALPPVEACRYPTVAMALSRVDSNGERVMLAADGFDGVPAGQAPAGWDVGDGAPAVVEDTAANGKAVLAPGNKVLRLLPGDYAFKLFDTPVSGRLEVELDYLSSTRDPGLLLVTLGRFDKADPEKRKTSYYTGDIGAYIHWQGCYLTYFTEKDRWTNFAVWLPRAWRKARFVLDVSKGVFDYYGSDGAFVSGGDFRGKQKAAFGIGLRNRGERWPIYVDNVVMRRIE